MTNLEQEILDAAGRRMAEEIDKEIVDNFIMESLIENGWTKTTINPGFTDLGMLSGKYEDWYSRTAEWIHLNATGDYKLLKGHWFFENSADATLFVLKWT